MTRTRPISLLLIGLLSLAAGFVLDQILTAAGRPTFTPIAALPILLIILGAVCFAFAWPIRQYLRGKGPRVDPFQALRTVVLAKASALLGSAGIGFGAGLAIFLATRPEPPVGSLLAALAVSGSGVVLTVLALLSERYCTLPKDDDDDPTGTSASAEPAS